MQYILVTCLIAMVIIELIWGLMICHEIEKIPKEQSKTLEAINKIYEIALKDAEEKEKQKMIVWHRGQDILLNQPIDMKNGKWECGTGMGEYTFVTTTSNNDTIDTNEK
jgi:hypothetical protein